MKQVFIQQNASRKFRHFGLQAKKFFLCFCQNPLCGCKMKHKLIFKGDFVQLGAKPYHVIFFVNPMRTIVRNNCFFVESVIVDFDAFQHVHIVFHPKWISKHYTTQALSLLPTASRPGSFGFCHFLFEKSLKFLASLQASNLFKTRSELQFRFGEHLRKISKQRTCTL